MAPLILDKIGWVYAGGQVDTLDESSTPSARSTPST